RFIGTVGHPAAVRRNQPSYLREGRLEENTGLAGLGCTFQRKHPEIRAGVGTLGCIDKAPAIGCESPLRPGKSRAGEQALFRTAAVGKSPKNALRAVPIRRVRHAFSIRRPTRIDVSALKSQAGQGIPSEIVNPDIVPDLYGSETAIG